MIPFRQLNKTETVFERQDWGGNYQMIAVSRLLMYLERVNFPVTQLAITREKAVDIKRLRNINKGKLLAIKPENLRTPCLLIHDVEIDIIDGNHRYIYAYVSGRQFLPAYLVEPIIWKQYLVRKIPANTRVG